MGETKTKAVTKMRYRETDLGSHRSLPGVFYK